MVALTYIVLNLLVAIFAHTIASDKSPETNTMVLEFSARSPGFTHEVLKVPRNNGFALIPVNSIRLSKDSVIVAHYIDESLFDTVRYSLLDFGKEIADSTALKKNYVQKNTYLLGTDRYGRDVFSRLIVGARVSLSVGIISVLLSLLLGTTFGALAGYYGGTIDKMIMWLINILWSIPTILLVFAITLTLGKGFWEIFVAIGLTQWVGAARLIRGQVMAVKELDYITAARALGLSNTRIITRHILPNISGPIMVIASSNFAAAILTEAGLSFLGIGVQPPNPSWGLMIKEHYNFLVTDRPFSVIIPGVAIMLLVYSFNILANTLRDIFDVKSR